MSPLLYSYSWPFLSLKLPIFELISVNISKPKLLFLKENHKNDNWDEFSDFHEVTLNMIGAIFLKLVIPIMAIIVQKFLKSYIW